MELSSQRRWQLRKVSLGLCEKCGKQARSGHISCDRCGIKSRERQRARMGFKGRTTRPIVYGETA